MRGEASEKAGGWRVSGEAQMPFDASPRVARAARAVHPGRDRRRERVRAREEGVKPRGPRAYLSSISAAMAPPEARRAVAPRRDATTLSPTTGLRADPTPERVRAAAPAPRTPAPASASSECPPRSRPCATSRRVRVCAPRRVRRRVRVCAPLRAAPRRDGRTTLQNNSKFVPRDAGGTCAMRSDEL